MADQPSGPPSTAVSNVHPSRATNFAPATTKTEPKKPKEKTKAKKRYLAKKARRHKISSKAKKASAPKNKEWKPSDADSPAVADDTPADAAVPSNAQAGPSRLPAPVATPAPAITENGAMQKDNKRKRKDETGTGEGLNAVEEASARERRKLEKKAKRAARDHEEKRRRKEERAKARALKEQPGASVPVVDKGKSRAQDAGIAARSSDEQQVEEEESSADEEVQEDDAEETASVEADGDDVQADGPDGRESPPPLMAFPSPTPAAAPDPASLSRQGLPENSANATLIDQDSKVGIDELEVTYPDGMRKGLGESMASHSKQMGVEELFAVQAAMLPHLLPLPLVPNPFEPSNDYLISAPTGSGKTLAYTIPIINILKHRQVVRLRALIVLPTRDLVVQVRETMEASAKGTGLIIGSATGQHSFSHEQNQLIADKETRSLGGSSKVDILIATPGRLIDHITQTPNFTLQHSRFLIIDEADRSSNQSFHNWLQQVLSHTRPPTKPVDSPADFVWQPWDQIATEWQVAYGLIDTKSQWYRPPKSTCQKLSFSATLTRDPAAIASLNSRNPQYYIVQESTFLDTTTLGESFASPSTLSEKYLASPPQSKPLNLIHLLHSPEFAVKGGLVFTKSVESVNRLVSSLSYFEEEYRPSEKVVVKGYTSEMRPVERKNLLSGFAKGEIHSSVCSDVIARGVDLPTVEHVISYDTPVDSRKYVHRVGRTARAGRSGTAWTSVEKQEALHFKGMMRAAGREKKVKKIKVKEDDSASYREAYERALERVKEVYVRHE